MIPMHPQTCPGQPDQLRWIIPAGLLSFTGTPAAVPEAVARLLDDGTLAEIRVEPGAVVTVLGAGGNWSKAGTQVRSALHAALADPAGWTSSETLHQPDDEALLAAAAALLDGPVGQFAQSHGGSIELIGVSAGIVTVRLAGACHGCPASRHTLRLRLETQLRRSCLDLRSVVELDRPVAAPWPSFSASRKQ
jgi:Fe-S cluster biogenesis protein NfuA